METTIAAAILAARKNSVAEGQKKYRTYFVKLAFLYSDYKEKTDAILILANAEGCIVTE